MTLLSELTIVSITYNNEGIYRTIQSIEPLLNNACKSIIQNGGDPISIKESKHLKVFNETDLGIYDALNKGLKKVQTKFFMFLHSGDEFIGTPEELQEILHSLETNGADISLNNQKIGNRLHSSRFWHPYLLQFGVQPPHLPTIYRSTKFNRRFYNTKIKVIADFDFYRNIHDWNYLKHNKLLIKMEKGGKTSNGISSLISVSLEFIGTYGFKGLIMAFTRIPFKLLQSIY